MTEVNAGRLEITSKPVILEDKKRRNGDFKMEEKIIQINKLINEIAVEVMSKSETYGEAYDKVWNLKNIDKEMRASISHIITSYSDKEKPLSIVMIDPKKVGVLK
ncbi:hypothetical protein [Lactococcus formosensis]|uniref:hypothetical protein n=1 Tax=Lactococcus formosensis TaxID=1281486 RepID=UPI00288EEACC|nr:hypothetical protein [Lactococcus formosensis]MDT2726493.1 hypothetical protein [Lactococcus formosensis]